MTELPFFHDDGAKTLIELLALRGKYRADSIVMAIDDRLQRYPVEPPTQVESIILAIEELERRVNGGGFESFFTSEPHLAQDIGRFLEEIHCPNTATIVATAVTKLGVQDLKNLDEIQAKASEIDFAEEDNAFIAYPDDIVELLLSYISDNQDSVRLHSSQAKVS